MMQAAAVATSSVRKELVYRLAKWVNETVTDLPFVDIYDTEGEGGWGEDVFFKARPVVGSHFARLVLERSCSGVGGLAFLEGR